MCYMKIKYPRTQIWVSKYHSPKKKNKTRRKNKPGLEKPGDSKLRQEKV